MRLRRSWPIFFAVVSVILPAVAARAGGPVRIISSQTQTADSPCKRCDLKNFTLQADDYAVQLPDSTVAYGTRSFARYQTRHISQLTEYGVAEFVRGCQYTSQIDGQGRVTRREDIALQVGGRIVDYRFKSDVIDELLTDPIDWGNDPHPPSRHAYYQWNRVPGSFSYDTREWYGQTEPTNPALYVSEHPGTAFYDRPTRSARNISVQMRSCVYRAADVPKNVAPADTGFAKPIVCFDWKSSFVYDFKNARFKSSDKIDPFCLQGDGDE